MARNTSLSKLAFEAMPTTPVENLIEDRMGEWVDLCMKTRKAIGQQGLVHTHKKKLGPQAFTYNNGEFRYWVWERKNLWRIFISDFRGLCFEVPGHFNAFQCFKAFDDYRKTMGL